MATTYTLPSETKFIMLLIQHLGDDYEIIKSHNKQCSVDFLIVNKLNLKTITIEHKYRKCVDIFDTLFIGSTKLNNIITKYDSNCILVWEFEAGELYFIKTTPHFLKIYKETTVCGGDCLEIVKKDCEKDTSNLIFFIKNQLL